MLGQSLLALTALAGTVIAAPSKLEASVITGVNWSVTKFTRVCTTTPSACTYNFTIVPGSGSANATCSITDTGADPVHNSLVGSPCTGDDGNTWTISWGYNTAGDTAVMTVVNTAWGEDAFFGWTAVSTTANFPNVGPNPVYALGTFTK